VDVLITDLAVFRFTSRGLVLTRVLDGHSVDEVRARTEAAFLEELEDFD